MGKPVPQGYRSDIPEEGDMAPVVSELADAGSLAFSYRISTPIGRILVLPGRITSVVLRDTGQVACKKYECAADLAPSATLYTAVKGWDYDQWSENRLAPGGYVFLDWQCTRTSEIARLAILSLTARRAPQKTLIWRGQCLPCCTKFHYGGELRMRYGVINIV